MSREYFEEVQRMRENNLLWLFLIPFSFLTFLPLIYGLYVQLVTGIPWGDEPMSDAGLLAITCFVALTIIGVLVLMYNMRLEVKINAQGIHYRFIPFRRKWTTLAKENVESYEVRKRKSIFETSGHGYRHKRIQKILAMSIRGPEFLVLELNDGYRLMLGTQNREGIERAVKKVMSNAYTE